MSSANSATRDAALGLRRQHLTSPKLERASLRIVHLIRDAAGISANGGAGSVSRGLPAGGILSSRLSSFRVADSWPGSLVAASCSVRSADRRPHLDGDDEDGQTEIPIDTRNAAL